MQNETYEHSSLRLERELAALAPEELPGFLCRRRAELITGARPFAAYLRRKLREKGLRQQNVFLAADLSENYGYKLVSEEKRTRRRDTILRLCFAARLTPEELREALTLYGMAPLYARAPRDAALLVCAYNGIHDLQEINRVLASCGLAPLAEGYE